MRGHEFLEKLTHIDDGLIERSQTFVKKTPYLKWISIAACFLIVVTAGILSIPKLNDDNNLPILNISEDFGGVMGFEGYLAYNIDELTNANPWRENQNITQLPVINNSLIYNDNHQVGNMNIEKMKSLLIETAENLGMDAKNLPIKDDSPTHDQRKQLAEKLQVDIDKIPEEYLAVGRVFIEDDIHKLEVDSTFTAKFELKNPITLPDGYNFTHTSSYDELLKVANYLKKEYSKYINMSAPQINISTGDYNIYGEQHYSISFFEGDNDNVQNILNYNFTSVTFHCDDNGKLWLSRNYQADLSNVIGSYPIITAKEALKLLKNKNYITTVPEKLPGTQYIKKVELVYKNETREEVYIPYYKFYVELPSMKLENGLNTYGAFYVPAVQGKYIAKMPIWDGRFN